MKKIVITSTILMSLIWFSLTSLMNSVKADEYNTAVIANVVTQTIQGNNVQTQKLMEQELERIGHLVCHTDDKCFSTILTCYIRRSSY
jgi:hypothetical protein